MEYSNIYKKLIQTNWYNILEDFLLSKDMDKIVSHIKERSKQTDIYPKSEDLFKAFNYFDFFDLKVVILGQD